MTRLLKTHTILAVCCLAIGYSLSTVLPNVPTNNDGAAPFSTSEPELAQLHATIERHEAWETSLIADKTDLLARLARAEVERDDLLLRVQFTESTLDRRRTRIVDRNNPFQQMQMRSELGFEDCESLQVFLSRSSRLLDQQVEIGGLPKVSSRAVLSMLLVSSLFEFGIAAPNDGSPGCISDVVRRERGPDEPVRFKDFQVSKYGCCVDFSVLLAELLRYQDIPCELRVSRGHAIVEAHIEPAYSLLLDASSCLMMTGFDSRAIDPMTIYRFPTRDGSQKIALQLRVIFGLVFLLEEMRPDDFLRRNYREFCDQYGIHLD